VLANSVAVVALRATNLLARLVVLFAIARHASPADFGRIVLALSVAEIAKVAADFGMDTLAIREYALDAPPGGHGRFAASLAAAKLAFGVAAYAVLVAWFAWGAEPGGAGLAAIVGATALTSQLVNFSLDWFQARLRIARVVAPVVATNLLLATAAVLALPRLPHLSAQAALFPAMELAVGLVLFAALAREGVLSPPRLAFGRVAGLARRSLPIALTALAIMTYSRLDVLVLARRLDAAAVGHYGMAFRLTEPFQIAAAAFGLSVFSRFSAWFGARPAVPVRAAAVRYLSATLAYGATAALALVLVAPPVIERWFPSYTASVPVLRLLAAALVFRSLNATLAGILQGAGRFHWLAMMAAWNLGLVFGLLALLVNRFEAEGAAMALLATEGLNTVVQTTLVARLAGAHDRTVERA
jgi:O-antigen/teichoic acid export membrane protein